MRRAPDRRRITNTGVNPHGNPIIRADAHARRYGTTCGSKEPVFKPDAVVIPEGLKGGMTIEHVQTMGRVFAQENSAEIQQIINALDAVDKIDGIPLTKAFSGLTVSIGTTPTPIITPDSKKAYLLINPASEVLGQTASSIIQASTTISATTNTGTVDVSGVEDLHVFFNPTAITGQWRIWLQCLDPVTGTNYANAQLLYDTNDGISAGAGACYYAYPGSYGITDTIRFQAEEVSAGSLTYSLGIVRKKNIGTLDVTSGVVRTIYLGNQGVSVTSGYPLLEGNQEVFIIGQNVDLHGIANVTTNLKIFQLEA